MSIVIVILLCFGYLAAGTVVAALIMRSVDNVDFNEDWPMAALFVLAWPAYTAFMLLALPVRLLLRRIEMHVSRGSRW